MFETRKTFSHKAADAADLMIDFATLGEYGLEPPDRPKATCEGRRRRPGTPPRATGSWNAAVRRFSIQS